jgi:Glycosyl transferases group 1
VRCLLITKEFSRTPTSGGMLRTLALLEQLAAGFETTLISPDSVVEAGPQRPIGSRPVASSPSGRLDDLRTAPTYRSISGVRLGGARLLANLRRGAHGHYDVAVIDHTCLAGLADSVAVGCDRLLVSMHNIESDLMAQRAAAAGSRRSAAAMRVETHLLRRLEAHVAARWPVVVCTEADARALGPRSHPVVARNGVFDRSAPPAGERPPHSMVFSGALDWEPNVEGLRWFAEHCWPLVRARLPQASVTVAGRRPGPAVVEACRGEGITLLANPPVMADVLDRHALGIVPLLSGGGSRIKILEYLAAGIDIVSTDVGASGLEDVPDTLMDRLPVDPHRFAERVVQRLREPRDTSAAAPAWVRENYSWEVTLRPLLEFLAG